MFSSVLLHQIKLQMCAYFSPETSDDSYHSRSAECLFVPNLSTKGLGQSLSTASEWHLLRMTYTGRKVLWDSAQAPSTVPRIVLILDIHWLNDFSSFAFLSPFQQFCWLVQGRSFCSKPPWATRQRCQDDQKVSRTAAIYIFNSFKMLYRLSKTRHESLVKEWINMGKVQSKDYGDENCAVWPAREWLQKVSSSQMQRAVPHEFELKGNKKLLKWIESNWNQLNISVHHAAVWFFFNLFFSPKLVDPSRTTAMSQLRLLLGARCRTSTGWSGRQDVARRVSIVSTVHRSQVCAWLQIYFCWRTFMEDYAQKSRHANGRTWTFFVRWVSCVALVPSEILQRCSEASPNWRLVPITKRRPNVEMKSLEEVLW